MDLRRGGSRRRGPGFHLGDFMSVHHTGLRAAIRPLIEGLEARQLLAVPVAQWAFIGGSGCSRVETQTIAPDGTVTVIESTHPEGCVSQPVPTGPLKGYERVNPQAWDAE